MSEFYDNLNRWFRGEIDHIIKGCTTSDEFDECKLDVLKLLENYPGTDLEATFTMNKITVNRNKGTCIIDKITPLPIKESAKEKMDRIRGRRAEFGILDDYREHNADDINNIIVPLLEVPPLTEERVTELVNAVNNARTHSL